MPTGYTYTSYQAAVVTQIPTVLTDPNFVTMLPNSIDYAELSIYRDLDFLCMKGELPLANVIAGQNNAAVPTSVIVVESAWASNNAGGFFPLTPASLDYIRGVYGGAANGLPQYFAITGAANSTNTWTPGLALLFGPPSNGSYTIVGYCSQRAPPLSATNTTTFISLNLPDLFWAAAMIYWAGYMKNFGAQADDPRMAVSWTAEYARLLKGAEVEQARLKFMSQGWQATPPAQIAQPRT